MSTSRTIVFGVISMGLLLAGYVVAVFAYGAPWWLLLIAAAGFFALGRAMEDE